MPRSPRFPHIARSARSRSLLAVVLAAGVVLSGAPALGGEVVCPVVADNSIASYSTERGHNYGNQPEMKMKGRENQAILKFDLSGIPAGATVTKAVLSVQLTGPEYRINQVGYSTVPTDWVEGDGVENNPANACHKWPGGSGRAWGDKGSMILDVIHGNGGNVAGWVLARKVGDRYELDISPRAIEAMRADQPGGLILMDESGWWSGRRSNIYLRSRESKAGPKLTVTYGAKDAVPPSPAKVRVIQADLDDGQMLVEIVCGGDDAGKGSALGYDMRLLVGQKLTAANWSKGKAVPRYRVPRPKAAGEKIRVWLTGLKAGAAYSVGVVAYDEGGNRSAVGATAPTKATGPTTPPRLAVKPLPIRKGGPVKLLAGLQAWAVDELTKVDPTSGKVLDGPGYTDAGARRGNTVWDGKDKRVVLHAARGEIMTFRLVLERTGDQKFKGITVVPADLQGPGGSSVQANRIGLRREWYLKTRGGWYGNAIPHLGGKDDGRLDIPAGDNGIEGQKLQTLLVEIAVPAGAKPGQYNGALTIAAGQRRGAVPIHLTVYDAVIPDELSFIIELNSYGQRDKKTFHALHRLAHRFRLGYNVLAYGHTRRGSLVCLPKIVGKGAAAKVADWSMWDEWMGPVLDGSLFADLPRGKTPIPHFYLPFHDSYPTEIYDEYADGTFHLDRHLAPGEEWNQDEWRFYVVANDVYVADGFSDTWKAAAEKVTREWREHFEAKGWTRTELQIFANNKLYFRDRAGSRASALWTLDEPSYGRDFRALGFVYRTFKKPFEGTSLNVVTRGDVSRPQWQGDRLDGASDVSVVSSAIYYWQPMIQRRRIEQGDRYWFYGGSPSLTTDLTQLAALYIKNWTLGCDGGLAYWTSFQGNKWDEAERLAVVLSGAHGYDARAVATDRIAAQRRAQQDIELLTMLAKKKGWSRRRVARAVTAAANLESKTVASGADDPGKTSFDGVRAKDLAAIRLAVLKELAK